MPSCDEHGIKISWKGYPKCPACEHMALETRELHADLARSQRVVELMAKLILWTANGLKDAGYNELQKPTDPPITLEEVKDYFHAKASAEVKDGD